MQKYTTELLCNNQMKIRQPAKGYRFSMDPILLTEHAVAQINMMHRNLPGSPQEEESHSHCPQGEAPKLHASHDKSGSGFRILDIGTGSAVIPLLLAWQLPCPEVRIIGVEIQKELAQIAGHNIDFNRMANRITLLHKDIRVIRPPDTGGPFDVVISNPPYQKKESSRLNPQSQKAIARHEITLCLKELIQSAARFLKHRGTLHLIYPAQRLTELLSTMQHNSIAPAALRFIHTGKERNAKLLLISGIKNSSASVAIHPPLYLEEYNNAAHGFDTVHGA